MGVLPQAAIELLPLSAEPMSQWTNEIDIYLFAKALYPPPFYSPSIAELDDDAVKEMREQARVFTKNLMEAQNKPTYIDFDQDHWASSRMLCTNVCKYWNQAGGSTTNRGS